MRSQTKGILILLALTALFFGAAYAAELPAVPPDYVVDLAGIVDDGTERAIDGYLRELEQKTSAQVVVLTVDTIDGQDISSYGLQVAERWKLGQKGKDNGMLIVFAMKERKYRFEVGYGLEGILPDSMVGSIGREYIVPYFKAGEYGKGVAGAAMVTAGLIAKDQGVEITGMPVQRISRTKAAKRGGPAQLAFMVLIGIVMLYLFIRHPRLFLLMLLASGGHGRGGGQWSGGGGFGGGGGGGFGGGGASGGW